MTTARAEYRSVLSMPLNTLLLSAAFPSGPVMWDARPFAWDPVIARMEPAALAAGGQDNGPPGVRRVYHEYYYGAYVLDPEGNNIEAVTHEPE